MTIDRIVRLVAGFFIMVSLLLGYKAEWNPVFISEYFLIFTAFVGFNLFQSALTRFCPLDMILARLGVKR